MEPGIESATADEEVERPRRLADELRPTLALALPIIASQLAIIAVNLVTLALGGRLSKETLAAVGLADGYFTTAVVIALGGLSASGVLISRAIGAGRPLEAGAHTRHGLAQALVSSALGILALGQVPALLTRLGHDPALAARVGDFLDVLRWAIIPQLFCHTVRLPLLASGRPGLVTLASIVAVSAAAGSGEIMTFGGFGVPAMGVVGIGRAVSVGFAAMGLVLLGSLAILPDLRRLRVWSGAGRKSNQILDMIGLAWPSAVAFACESLFFTAISTVAGYFSAAQLAAHGVTLQCAASTFMIAIGLSQAAMVRIAAACGRGDIAQVRAIGGAAITLGLLGMGACGLFFIAFPNVVLGWFIDIDRPDGAEVMAAAAPLLFIAALFQLFDGTQAIAGGALRGLGDGRGPMLIALAAYWPFGFVGGAVLAFGFHLGTMGLWIGIASGLGIAALANTRRFFARAGGGPAARALTADAGLP